MPRDDSAVWGVGFVEDEWTDMASVEHWDEVDPDEYVRLFPRLVPRSGSLPERLRRHLEIVLDRVSVGDRDNPVRHERLVDGLRQIVHDRSIPEVQNLAPATPTSFAFATGVHPAYLWPAEALAPGRGTTAAWLGILARGRPAMMPPEVAEYLVDVIERLDGQLAIIRDPAIGALVDPLLSAEVAWRAAQDRRRGIAKTLRADRLRPKRSVWEAFCGVAAGVTHGRFRKT